MSTNENDVHWYVFSINFKKELEVRNQLLSLGYDAYVPMHYRLQTIHGRRVRINEPSIFGLVFAKGSRKDLLQFREQSKLKGYMFLKSRRTMEGELEYVCVRDTDMENFRKLNEVQGAQLTYYKPEELRLAKGEKVKIMDGPFEGIIGTIQKLPHKRGQYLVVSIPNVAFAAVSIRPDYIKPLSHKVAKSTDVEKDSKMLAKLALQIITNDDTVNKQLILQEIQQIEESLQDCKVFLPNDKANYYFAFFLSALAKKEDTSEYKCELEKILPKLKSNNLLLPSAHIMFYYETKNYMELEKAENIISKWDRTKYTDAQKYIIKLQHFVKAETKDDANNMQK